mmetsp:Transcript_12955/g.33758  ORF Transcript_12955/g.33758 Transcript_12955/m.33758 type:complete len:451 (+) Transcript_12955:73-1425(+)
MRHARSPCCGCHWKSGWHESPGLDFEVRHPDSSRSVGWQLSVRVHVHHAAQAVARVQQRERIIDLLECAVVCDVLVDLHLAVHVRVHELGDLRARLEAAKGRALPHAPCDELEGAGGDLLTCTSDTDDDGLSPADVAALQCDAHQLRATDALESVVEPTSRHLHQRLLQRFVSQLARVDALCRAKLERARKLLLVNVDADDATGADLLGRLDHGEPDRAEPEDGTRRAGLHLRRVAHGAPAGGEAAAKQVHLVERRIWSDLGDGLSMHNRVLREGGRAHVVVNRQPVRHGGEARVLVGRHHARSREWADLAAQVRLITPVAPAPRAVVRSAVLWKALSLVARDHRVARRDVHDPLADRLNDAGGLMAENARELALSIFAREGEGVRVTQCGVGDLNANFTALGRRHDNLLNAQRVLPVLGLGCARDGSEAGNRLPCRRRRGAAQRRRPSG